MWVLYHQKVNTFLDDDDEFVFDKIERQIQLFVNLILIWQLSPVECQFQEGESELCRSLELV